MSTAPPEWTTSTPATKDIRLWRRRLMTSLSGHGKMMRLWRRSKVGFLNRQFAISESAIPARWDSADKGAPVGRIKS